MTWKLHFLKTVDAEHLSQEYMHTRLDPHEKRGMFLIGAIHCSMSESEKDASLSVSVTLCTRSTKEELNTCVYSLYANTHTARKQGRLYVVYSCSCTLCTVGASIWADETMACSSSFSASNIVWPSPVISSFFLGLSSSLSSSLFWPHGHPSRHEHHSPQCSGRVAVA